MEFTKGEWTTYRKDLAWSIYASEKVIATVHQVGVDTNANAHLIAASKEMYEALKDTLFDLEHGFLGDSPLVSKRELQAKQALAKAEGK